MFIRDRRCSVFPASQGDRTVTTHARIPGYGSAEASAELETLAWRRRERGSSTPAQSARPERARACLLPVVMRRAARTPGALPPMFCLERGTGSGCSTENKAMGHRILSACENEGVIQYRDKLMRPDFLLAASLPAGGSAQPSPASTPSWSLCDFHHRLSASMMPEERRAGFCTMQDTARKYLNRQGGHTFLTVGQHGLGGRYEIASECSALSCVYG